MPNGLETDLRQLIADKQIVVIVGSGVSIAATKNAPAASWTGLLKLGVSRCRELDSRLKDSWESQWNGLAESINLDVWAFISVRRSRFGFVALGSILRQLDRATLSR
ncbi:MAG: hypothetical protein ACYDC1_04640 [Limisphaerales bacterium]